MTRLASLVAAALFVACTQGGVETPDSFGNGGMGAGGSGDAGQGGVGGTGGVGPAGGHGQDGGGHGGTAVMPASGGSGGQASVGPKDAIAAAACAALRTSGGAPGGAVTMKPLEAVTSSEDTVVAEASLMVDGSTAYKIKLPQGSVGYASLVQEHWDATVAFFAPSGVKYEVINQQMTPLSQGPLINAACPDANITDYRISFTHWSLATIKFAAEGPREILFMTIKQP